MGLLDIGSGIIGGVTNLIGQGMANRQQRQNIKAQNTGNMALAKYQYSNEIDMWNRANQYNTPASQMDRFRQAGLNPNLIYGQGSSGNSPNALPRYQAPSMRYDNPPPLNPSMALSAFQDYRLKTAQVDNLQAHNKTIALENGIKALQLEKTGLESQYWGTRLGLTSEDGKPLYGTVKQKYLQGNQQVWLKDTELAKSQQDLKRKIIENAMLEIDKQWQKAEKWIGAGSKVLGAIPGKISFGGNFSGKKMEPRKLRGKTSYYYE
nr:MAG: DNA pilot protein [Microvirus sp.]